MKLDNEFRVHAPIERAWEVLTDIPAITPCLPGAALTDHDGNVYRGTVKIKVGPVTSKYEGKAVFAVVDEEQRHIEIAADGRDSRGSGNASASITADMRVDGEYTVVKIATDLKVAGKVAQFGKGMIAEVSGKLIDQFVTCIEQELLGDKVVDDVAAASADGAAPADSKDGAADTVAPTRPPLREVDALDLMDLAGGSVYKRLLPVGIAAGLLFVLALLLRRR
jgi:carbon monoxide dehydrogenase subunit G